MFEWDGFSGRGTRSGWFSQLPIWRIPSRLSSLCIIAMWFGDFPASVVSGSLLLGWNLLSPLPLVFLSCSIWVPFPLIFPWSEALSFQKGLFYGHFWVSGGLREAEPSLMLFHIRAQYNLHSLAAWSLWEFFLVLPQSQILQPRVLLRECSPRWRVSNFGFFACSFLRLIGYLDWPFHFLLILPLQSWFCAAPTALGVLDTLSDTPGFRQFPSIWWCWCCY